MCDALSSNMPAGLRVILANCLAHGRRNFEDVVAHFRTEGTYVLNCQKKVYQTDAEAHQEQLSPDERLRRHQAVSGPVMEELHRWLNKQFDDRNVERYRWERIVCLSAKVLIALGAQQQRLES